MSLFVKYQAILHYIKYAPDKNYLREISFILYKSLNK